MKLSFEVIGNHDLKVMSSSIQIKSGDFFAIINISASYNASEYIAFIIFSKEESGEVKKYQEVYPLQVAIEMRNKIFIFSNETASIYAGGKSFYFYISLSDIPNIPISVILNSTQKDLVVLGSTIKDFNENKTINKFRLQLSENVDITQYYSIELKIIDSNYSNYFELYNQKITVKVFQRPINLNSYSLKFHAKVEISCKRIDIFISRLNFPIMIYYQIFKKINNNLLELSFEEIIKKNDEAIDSKINFENMILGIFYCDQTSEICSEQISGLEVIGYYIKCIGVSPAGVQAQETYSIYFEPYRKKINK